jgi:hypothetical protein
MDTRGHPGRIGLYVAGHAQPDDFPNCASHEYALYGDPLLRPFGEHRSPASVDASVNDRGAFVFRVTRSGRHGRTWYRDRARDSARCRIYEVVPVAGGGRPTVARVRARTADDDEIPVVKTTALIERIDGASHLHLEIVADDHLAFREKGATVEVSVELR